MLGEGGKPQINKKDGRKKNETQRLGAHLQKRKSKKGIDETPKKLFRVDDAEQAKKKKKNGGGVAVLVVSKASRQQDQRATKKGGRRATGCNRRGEKNMQDLREGPTGASKKNGKKVRRG